MIQRSSSSSRIETHFSAAAQNIKICNTWQKVGILIKVFINTIFFIEFLLLTYVNMLIMLIMLILIMWIMSFSKLYYSLKLVSVIFYQMFIFHQMIALQKLWKMFLIHLKSSFLSGDIQIFVFPSSFFFPYQPLL